MPSSPISYNDSVGSLQRSASAEKPQLKNCVRYEHVAGEFDVGGTQAPYPGWWGLPARQRIHCRCTKASVIRD
jgi:hypothetical protein